MKPPSFLKNHLPAVLLVVLLIAFRLIGMGVESEWANVQPLAAVTFCAVALVGWRALWVPALAWGLSYIVMLFTGSFTMGWDILAAALGFSLVALVGYRFQKVQSFTGRLSGVALGSLLFYFAANTISWLTLPDYPRTLEGLMQAQWFGPPHLGPTWVFLRSSLISDLVFTSVFLLALNPVLKLSKKETLAQA